MDIKAIAVENKEAAIGGLAVVAAAACGAFMWRRHKNKKTAAAEAGAYQEVISNLKKAVAVAAAMDAVKESSAQPAEEIAPAAEEPVAQTERPMEEVAVVQATIRTDCHPLGWKAAVSYPEQVLYTPAIPCPGDPRFTRRGFTSWVNSEGCVGVVHITKANTSIVWCDPDGKFYGTSTIKGRWETPELTTQEVENFLKGR